MSSKSYSKSRVTSRDSNPGETFVVTLVTDQPRPHLARYLKRVAREERLTCTDLRRVRIGSDRRRIGAAPRSRFSPTAPASVAVQGVPESSHIETSFPASLVAPHRNANAGGAR